MGSEEAMKNIYDVIITDAVLPGMTGGEIIKKIRGEAAMQDVPIILLSASLDEQQFEEASVGATKSFLKTKITPSELVYEVNALFSGKE